MNNSFLLSIAIICFIFFENGDSFRIPAMNIARSFSHIRSRSPLTNLQKNLHVLRMSTNNWIPKSESEMSVEELKEELELRRVDFSGCISKLDLITKLREARALGAGNNFVLERASHNIIDTDAVDAPSGYVVDPEVVSGPGAKVRELFDPNKPFGGPSSPFAGGKNPLLGNQVGQNPFGIPAEQYAGRVEAAKTNIKKELEQELGSPEIAEQGTQILQELARDPKIMQMLMDPKIQELMEAVINGGEAAFMAKYAKDPVAMRTVQMFQRAMEEKIQSKFGKLLSSMPNMMKKP